MSQSNDEPSGGPSVRPSMAVANHDTESRATLNASGAPALPLLAPRARDSHKGTFGQALLIGGSRGMSGSIAIAGMAALRSGAGLVRLAIPDRCLETVAAFSACYMTIPLPDTSEGQLNLAAEPLLIQWSCVSTCVGIGPGLGQSPDIHELVTRLFREIVRTAVFDADALNSLAKTDQWRASVGSERILTPHPVEFQRLSGVSASNRTIQIDAAIAMARERRVIIVLKGNRTLVTDGERVVENSTGNPAMASGGSGDCLTGIIVALVCQGLRAFDASVLGTFVHGLAGDIAHEQMGGPCVLATDLVQRLPEAFSSIRKGV